MPQVFPCHLDFGNASRDADRRHFNAGSQLGIFAPRFNRAEKELKV